MKSKLNDIGGQLDVTLSSDPGIISHSSIEMQKLSDISRS